MVKIDTRDRVVDAALRLFNERGTAAVSTNHVAKAAGISPGNLYYHYRNKEQIILAIFERMIASYEVLSTLPQDRVSTLTDLRTVLRETFSVLWEYRFFSREFVALMNRDPELRQRYRNVRERGLTSTEALLKNFAESGVLRELEDPSVVPKLAQLFWLIAEFWLPFTEMVEEVVKPERLQEGVDLMMQVLEPYLTEEALAELGLSRQELHIQGGNES